MDKEDPRDGRRGLHRLARGRRARAGRLRAVRRRQLRQQLAVGAPRLAGELCGRPVQRWSRRTSATPRRCADLHDHAIAGVVHCAGLKAVGEGEAAARVLGRQRRRHDRARRGDGRGGRGAARLLELGDRLRTAGRAAGRGGCAARPGSVYGRTKADGRDFLRDLARQRQLAHRDLRFTSARRRPPSSRIGGVAPTGRRTSCRCWAGSPPARSPGARGLRRRLAQRTAPACATTCTCGTSPEGHVAAMRYLASRAGPRRRSTSAWAAAGRCSRRCAFERAHAEADRPDVRGASSRRRRVLLRGPVARRRSSAGWHAHRGLERHLRGRINAGNGRRPL